MDDLISRSDAIGAVKEERFPIDSDYAEGFMAALDKVEWILKEWLPSAQPEVLACGEGELSAQSQRKKGKWIYLDKDKRFFHPHIVKCSVCDNTLDMYGVNAGRGDANFCPNCGADMRTPVETARDIVHKAIDNSVWSDIVDTAEMHKVVDDWCAENGGDVNADVES